MKTSIIIPVIRPAKVHRLKKLIKKNAKIPDSDYEILTEIDHDRIGCPKMVEKMVNRANFETIMFLGDDTLPQDKFLKNAILAMKRFRDDFGLVALSDLTGRINLATHWLGHRELLPLIGGQFFHTGYMHCCCDVELSERSREVGRFIYAHDAIVKHDHPLLHNKPITDKDYLRVYSDEYLKHDRELLNKRRESGWTKNI
jgi:hypothetical protein